jgi:tRNA(Leu) C34 or U34 (ribose-2'-O)-methylase TrmL
MDNLEAPHEISRIATFGLYDFKNSSEAPLFLLDGTRDKCYYYCINNEVINSDGKLLKNIKEHLLIPVTGAVESLNVSNASAVILSEWYRQGL